MSPPAAQLLFELCFVCIRPILTNLFSVEHFCPLTIRVNRALTALDVRGNALGDGSTALAEAVSKHQQIVTFCEVPVKQMRDDALVELDLKQKGIGACGAMVVAHLLEFSRALNTLNLSDNKIGAYDRDGDNTAPWIPTPGGPNALFESLKANSTLTSLDFSKDYVDAAGAKGIAECIKVNKALNSVDLRSNQIPDEGKQQLRDAVREKSITLQL